MLAATRSDFYPTYLDIRNDPQKSNRYPGHLLTSPIAYYGETPVDHFNTKAAKGTDWSQWGKEVEVSFVMSWAPLGLKSYKNRDDWTFRDRSTGETVADFFTCEQFHVIADSTGPDSFWWHSPNLGNANQGDINPLFYDPTNGTVSWGQILWLDCGGVQSPK